jgi:hypothetical protein
MERIVVEIYPAAGTKRELYVFDRPSVTLGRGYGSDIILADPYISASHLQVRVDEGKGFVITDLSTRNGTFLSNDSRRPDIKKRITEETVITSGQAVYIGNTVVRFYSADHPVAATRHMHSSRMDILQLSRPMTTLYALVGVFLAYFIQAVVTMDSNHVNAGKIFFVELLTFLAVLLWPGFWALLGRVIRHRPRFQLHLTITLIYMFVMLPLTNLTAFLGYVFMNMWIEYTLGMLLSGTAFALLFFGNLTYATHLGLRARIITSAAIPLLFVMFVSVGMFMFQDRFNPEPPYYARLKPPYFRPLKVYDIDGAIGRLDKVFVQAREQKRTE